MVISLFDWFYRYPNLKKKKSKYTLPNVFLGYLHNAQKTVIIQTVILNLEIEFSFETGFQKNIC